MKSNLSTDETTESESGELACVDAILIQVTNVNLNRGVVLGGDESVCGRALPRNVKLGDLSLFVLHFGYDVSLNT